MASRRGSDPIGRSLVDPVRSVLVEAADLGLDELLSLISENAEVLEKVPVVKWLFLANDVRTKIQVAFFVRKYANFIGAISEVVEDNPKEMSKLEDLFKSDREYRRLVEQTIVAIDRYQTEFKAKLVGVLFRKTFAEGIFSLTEYNKLLFSIENMHPVEGVECLRGFYRYRVDMESAKDEESKRRAWRDGAALDYSALANTGLLRLPVGGAYVGDLGGAYLSDLGEKFFVNVVAPSEG